jgi:hypothetical protein
VLLDGSLSQSWSLESRHERSRVRHTIAARDRTKPCNPCGKKSGAP